MENEAEAETQVKSKTSLAHYIQLSTLALVGFVGISSIALAMIGSIDSLTSDDEAIFQIAITESGPVTISKKDYGINISAIEIISTNGIDHAIIALKNGDWFTGDVAIDLQEPNGCSEFLNASVSISSGLLLTNLDRSVTSLFVQNEFGCGNGGNQQTIQFPAPYLSISLSGNATPGIIAFEDLFIAVSDTYTPTADDLSQATSEVITAKGEGINSPYISSTSSLDLSVSMVASLSNGDWFGSESGSATIVMDFQSPNGDCNAELFSGIFFDGIAGVIVDGNAIGSLNSATCSGSFILNNATPNLGLHFSGIEISDVFIAVSDTYTPPMAECTDSDGRYNYYEKGIVEISDNLPGYEDSCANESGVAYIRDTFPNRVFEWYCGADTSNNYSYEYDFLDCPYGCSEGACIEGGLEGIVITEKGQGINTNDIEIISTNETDSAYIALKNGDWFSGSITIDVQDANGGCGELLPASISLSGSYTLGGFYYSDDMVVLEAQSDNCSITEQITRDYPYLRFDHNGGALGDFTFEDIFVGVSNTYTPTESELSQYNDVLITAKGGGLNTEEFEIITGLSTSTIPTNSTYNAVIRFKDGRWFGANGQGADFTLDYQGTNGECSDWTPSSAEARVEGGYSPGVSGSLSGSLSIESNGRCIHSGDVGPGNAIPYLNIILLDTNLDQIFLASKVYHPTEEDLALLDEPAVCSNGVVDPSIGEQCDDGNTNSNDGCSATCQIEWCGDGILQDNVTVSDSDGNPLIFTTWLEKCDYNDPNPNWQTLLQSCTNKCQIQTAVSPLAGGGCSIAPITGGGGGSSGGGTPVALLLLLAPIALYSVRKAMLTLDKVKND